MRYLLLMLLATVLVFGGCSHVSSIEDGGTTDSDSDSDTGPVECNLGSYSGHFKISTQADVANIAGYTSSYGVGSDDLMILKVDEDGNIDPTPATRTFQVAVPALGDFGSITLYAKTLHRAGKKPDREPRLAALGDLESPIREREAAEPADTSGRFSSGPASHTIPPEWPRQNAICGDWASFVWSPSTLSARIPVW